MIELGKKQTLTVLRKTDHGIYVGETGEDSAAVLLPGKYVTPEMGVGSTVEVFIYRDSEDRLIATTQLPKVFLDELALLTVKDTTKIGAFLDWGLEKDLFLPFKEQRGKVRIGDRVLVTLYIDKSSRLCATMKVSRALSNEAPYQKEDKVSGIIYDIKPELGAFVAVDGKYFGLIPAQEWYSEGRVGDTVEARVLRVREDGKLDLSGRKKAYKQMEIDAEAVEQLLDEYAGVLPFTDKASPETIQRETGLSKAAFKRAVGGLLKAGKIEITETAIRKKG
ncbi:MAG: S1 RNA-binding domain-containing protein [Lachnospiraceae bacterium]|nr:S1 RNA-binding domain-containing protein [Lachnospiraceae bacterium]